MTVSSVVRRALPDDHQQIWKLFLQGHEENGIFTLAPEKVEFFLQRALHPDKIMPWDTGTRGEVAVIGPPGHLEALCFIVLGQFWYSNDFHLEELLVFVDPEHRNSGHAKALIDWMKEKSDELGIPVLTGIMSNSRTEAKVRLYRRQLPAIGAFFLYRPEKTATTNGMEKH